MGAKVSWNRKNGTISFVGETKFASGEWIGVTLDAAEGMHDGTVMGVSYFECSPKCGVFAQAAQLTAQGAAPAAPAVAAVATASAPQTSSAAAPSSLAVGTKVTWQGKTGTVSFIGSTRFAPGEWVGVTLDDPVGMHNGTVMGVEYFECAPKCGIFSQASQLTSSGAPPPASAPAASAPATSAPPAAAAAAPPAVGAKVSWNGKPGTVKYVGSARFAPGEWVGVELDAAEGMHNGSVMGVTYFECSEKCGIFAPAAQLQVLAHA